MTTTELIKRFKAAGFTAEQILESIESGKFTTDDAEKAETKTEEKTNVMPEKKFIFFYDVKKDGKKKITGVNYNFIAKWLMQHNDFLYILPNDRDKKGFYYVYKDGVYVETNEREIDYTIQSFLEYYGDFAVRPEYVHKTRDVMLTELAHSHSAKPTDFDKDENLINFQNGLLKLDTLELLPHNKNYLTKIQIPCNWTAAETDTPVFDKYMADFTTYRTEKDKVLIKKCFLEFIGLIVSNIPAYRYKKGCALLVWGSGDAGKSQLRNFAAQMIGEKNTAITELSELETREGPSKAFGCRMLGSGDMGFGTANQISKLKDITGGDPVTVRYLYVEGFSAKIDGVFWYCSNELPKFGGDQGPHVYNRFLPIRADYVVPEKDRDPLLLQKLLAEKEGILYKAILALKDTISAGYRHTYPDCAYEDIKRYKEENNIIVEFFNSCCTREHESHNDDGTVEMIPVENSDHTQAEIRKCFTAWAKANYNNVPNKRLFEKTIAEILGVKEEDLTYRKKDKRIYRYFDLSVDATLDWLI